MVQRIKNLPIIAVTIILKGEMARQFTAGIFYALPLNTYSVTPVWKVNASTALEVWPLAYSSKEKAVRALRSNNNFIKGVDYQFLAQNGEKSDKGRPADMVVLSVPCLEFFIARKVREVFEVYRLVFHAARKNDPEVEKLKDLVNHASTVVGSVNKLAKRMGVSAATFTNLFKQPQLLSADMRARIENTCTNIIENGVGVDPELVELLLDVEDKEVRKKLWTKYYC